MEAQEISTASDRNFIKPDNDKSSSVVSSVPRPEDEKSLTSYDDSWKNEICEFNMEECPSSGRTITTRSQSANYRRRRYTEQSNSEGSSEGSNVGSETDFDFDVAEKEQSERVCRSLNMDSINESHESYDEEAEG